MIPDVWSCVNTLEKWYEQRKEYLQEKEKAHLLHDVNLAVKVLQRIRGELKEEFEKKDEGIYDYGNVVLKVMVKRSRRYNFKKLREIDLPDDVVVEKEFKMVMPFMKNLK